MQRIEFIFSQSVDDDFLTLCEEHGVGKMYTKIPSVMGKGYSVPKMGDAVWPQLNCMYIIYCQDADIPKYRTIVETLRKKYPTEGIACFLS